MDLKVCKYYKAKNKNEIKETYFKAFFNSTIRLLRILKFPLKIKAR